MQDDDLSFEQNYARLEAGLKPGFIKSDRHSSKNPLQGRGFLHEDAHDLAWLTGTAMCNPLVLALLSTSLIGCGTSIFASAKDKQAIVAALSHLAERPAEGLAIAGCFLGTILLLTLFLTVFSRCVRGSMR
ncbi:MAG: hypothetical protein HC888_11485 [Candidatus Competibacteraceae bacterium]|nr:hypothetical protein [Candidatus Competibacteraceae bacterium]